MSPIAAYYVMIMADREATANARKRRYDAIVPRRSLLERIADALESLVSLGRPTTTQPI